MTKMVAGSILLILLGACEMLGLGEEMDTGEMSGDCGAEECDHELQVEILRSDSDTFESGTYRFALVAPDLSEYSIDCYLAHSESEMDCSYGDIDTMGVTVEDAATTLLLYVLGAPEYVLTTVEYNGYIIGERTLYPEYDEVTPNGEECPPLCYQGEEHMAVSTW